MSHRPDLVDFVQMVQRLRTASQRDITPGTLRTLQRRRAFPMPETSFGGEPIWWWDRIEHWGRQRGLSLRASFPEPALDVDLVGVDEIGARLRVGTFQARKWRRNNRLVRPDYRWSHAEAWLWPTVERWVRANNPPARAGDHTGRSITDPISQLEELSISLHNLQYLDVPPPPGDPLDLLGEELSEDRRDLDGLRDRMGGIAAFIARVDGGEKVSK